MIGRRESGGNFFFLLFGLDFSIYFLADCDPAQTDITDRHRNRLGSDSRCRYKSLSEKVSEIILIFQLYRLFSKSKKFLP
jgi:hypothetical protein